MSVRLSKPAPDSPELLQDDLIRVAARRAATEGGPAEMDLEELGPRLRRLRKDRELTLQEASRLSGVSTSAFSKIERNELSPTIGVMQRIAVGLGIELTALLGSEPPAREAFSGRRSISRAGQGSAYPNRTCQNVMLCADLKNKRVTPILTRVTARVPEDYSSWAKSDAEIFLMVLEGTLEVHSRAYETLALNKGDSLYYDAGVEHCWTSQGEEDAQLLWVLCPV